MVKLPLVVGKRRYSVTVLDTSGDDSLFRIGVEAEGASIGWRNVRLVARAGDLWTLEVDGRIEDALVSIIGDVARVSLAAGECEVTFLSDRERLRRSAVGDAAGGSVRVWAQMPGRIIRVLKSAGETVELGAGLAVMEAMKMQNEIRSPRSGVVLWCGIEAGGSVGAGDPLFEIGSEETLGEASE